MAIMDQYGIDYEYRAGDGYLDVEGNICWLVGCHNETAADTIKGMTIGGADLDEAETYPQNVLDTILDRLSLDDARAYMTMNSNSPYHPIKTELIDNVGLIEAGKLYTSHWELYDNPYLPEGYIKTMELRYPVGTLGWKRKIKGLWVLAEGAIYDQFVESKHTFYIPPFATLDSNGKVIGLNYDYYVLTGDEGRGGVTVIGLFGIKRTPNGNHYHLLNEAYWDISKHNGRQLTTNEVIHGNEELGYKGSLPMLKSKPLAAFITPHDASVLRADLAQIYYQGRKIPVGKYTPKVLEDIRKIQTLIAEERFMISNKNCPNSIAQAQSYVWDARLQKLGQDAPLKSNDHCPDMWRPAIFGTRGLTITGQNYPRSKKSYKYSKRGRGRSDGL